MSSAQKVYAISQSGYYYTQKLSTDQYIIQAKEKNIHLKFARCNQIFKGGSYFRNKKDQQYYKKMCQSVPVKKNKIFNSQITSGSTLLDQSRNLKKLNQLNVQTNKNKSRPTLVQSHHYKQQNIQQGRKISQIINTKNHYTELEQKYIPYQNNYNSALSQAPKQHIKTPKFSQQNFDDKYFKADIEDLENKKFISEQKIPQKQQNPENKYRKNYLRIIKDSQQIYKQRQSSPHCQRVNYLPKRLSQIKKNDSQVSLQCINEIERLRKQLNSKKEQIQKYKENLQDSRKKEEYLQQQLIKCKQQQIRQKVYEKQIQQSIYQKNVQGIINKSYNYDNKFINPQDALIHFTFLLIMLVKHNFHNKHQ